jgi:hypothetical protein
MSFLSEGLAPEDDRMEEDADVGESSSQTQVQENEPKFQVQLGDLPDKVDCKMILTLPREFMAKTNQNESLERDVVDTQ